MYTKYEDGQLIEFGYRERLSYDQLLERVTQPRKWTAHDSRTHKKDYDWDLNTGWKESLRLAQQGWPEGREALLQATGQANRAWDYTGQQVEMDVAGAAPDIPTYLTNDPECMYGIEEQAPEPVVRIAFAIGAAWHVTGQALRNLGSGILSAAQGLEMAGYSVEITGWSVTALHNDLDFEPEVYALECPIKEAGGLIDYDRAAFALTHPAMLRRIGFAWRERTDPRFELSNYGYAVDITQLQPVEADIVIPPLSQIRRNGRCDSPEEGLQIVLGCSKTFDFPEGLFNV